MVKIRRIEKFFKKPKTNEEREYRKEIKVGNLETKYNAMKEMKEFYEKRYKKLEKTVENFCKSIISNDYNMNQLGGSNNSKNLNIDELLIFFKKDYDKQKENYLKKISSLREKIEIQEQIIDNYKRQLTQTMIENSKDLKAKKIEDAKIIDNSEIIQPKVVKIEKDPLGKIKNIKEGDGKNSYPIVDFKNKSDISEERKETPILTIENMQTYVSAMTEIMWDILEAIGTQGFSESNDILNWMEKNKTKYGKTNILNSITTLRKMSILSAESISTGYRRFQIFKLSQKGEDMFKIYFKKDPVESEINKIVKDHCTTVHGYTIKDACKLLITNYKCTKAVMDRQAVSIKLPDGKTYIPDIVAIKDGKQMYVEVELGTTPQPDFNNKCNKMLQVTNHLFFISDTDETIKKKIEGQISMWILSLGGKEKIAGNTIYMTTMTQLSKGSFMKTLKY